MKVKSYHANQNETVVRTASGTLTFAFASLVKYPVQESSTVTAISGHKIRTPNELMRSFRLNWFLDMATNVVAALTSVLAPAGVAEHWKSTKSWHRLCTVNRHLLHREPWYRKPLQFLVKEYLTIAYQINPLQRPQKVGCFRKLGSSSCPRVFETDPGLGCCWVETLRTGPEVAIYWKMPTFNY